MNCSPVSRRFSSPATGTGPSLDLRISKSGGIPTQLVPEGRLGLASSRYVGSILWVSTTLHILS